MIPGKPAGAGGDSDLGEAGRVIATFVALVVVLVVVANWGCRRDPAAALREPPPTRDPPRFGLWEPDPETVARQEREREESRRQFAEDAARLKSQLDEKGRRIRTFDTEDKYLDAVGMANALGRESAAAQRLHLEYHLRNVQSEAVRAAYRIAKIKAVRLVGRDEYAAAARVMADLRADVGSSANECGLAKELDDLRQGFLFIEELAKLAERGPK